MSVNFYVPDKPAALRKINSNLPVAKRKGRRYSFNHVKFAELIQARRHELGLTLREMGERVGVSYVWIWNLENVPTASPRMDTLFKICNGYGLDPHEVIEEVA